MANYHYKARNGSGKTITGELVVADENELHQKLKENDLYPISWKQTDKAKRVKPIKVRVLAEFNRQIGMLVGSGVSLVRALNIIIQQENVKPAQKEVYEDVLRMVRQGSSLADALEQQNGAFPDIMVNMYRAAESTGSMDKTAMRLSEQFTKEHRLQSKINSSTLYPRILGVVIILVVFIILKFILPQFESMFAKMEKLPWPTEVLYAITGTVSKHFVLVLIAAVALFFSIRAICRMTSVRLKLDQWMLHMPLFGKLLKAICSARFARSLSSLYSAGVSMVTALQIARKTIQNSYIEKQFDRLIASVRGGQNLSDSLDAVDGFVKELSASVRVGEETGHLDDMLSSTAESLDYESDVAITKLVGYIEPIMILLMAVIIGFIMIAVLLPIYQSYQTIGH